MKVKTQLDRLRKDRGDGDTVNLGKSEGVELKLTAPDYDSDDVSEQGSPPMHLALCSSLFVCRERCHNNRGNISSKLSRTAKTIIINVLL